MDIDDANTFRQQMMALHRRMRLEHVGGISLNEVLILGAIDRLGSPATPGDVADDLHMARPNLAPLLRKLEGGGLIARTPDPVDGRRSVLALSPDGRRLLDRDRVERESWLIRAVENVLTPAEAAVLRDAGALMLRVAEYRPE